MNPAYLVLALLVTAVLAWSWAEAADAAADLDDEPDGGEEPAGSQARGDREGAPPAEGEASPPTTLDVWLLGAVLVAVEGAIGLGLALLPLP